MMKSWMRLLGRRIGKAERILAKVNSENRREGKIIKETESGKALILYQGFSSVFNNVSRWR